ncbi:Hypothetical predicted protein [Mytilus galloprovincialis]|uniref:Uncharacterized protein n=1 Tax=Mytilus galloprovincialis TaxID=29158 RepID=A0A8B6GAL6_MYTGA|nr:Hypothetical predicted protein [Mytilus galloprovincialis]
MQQRILEVNEKYDNKTKQISRELGTSESSMQNRITVLSTKLNGQIKNIQREQNETANKGTATKHGDHSYETLAATVTADLNVGDTIQKIHMAKKKKGLTSKQGQWSMAAMEIAVLKPEGLSAARSSMLNPSVVANYFEKLGSVMESLGVKDKPQQLYNADESGISTCIAQKRLSGKEVKEGYMQKQAEKGVKMS